VIWMPYICLGIGIIIGLNKLPDNFLNNIDVIITTMLLVLMLTIGISVGASESVMSSLSQIGFNCFVISLFAMIFSIGFTVIVEKTILPLEKISKNMAVEKTDTEEEIELPEEEQEEKSPLLWLMPISIILGVLIGYFIMPEDKIYILDYILTFSLFILFVGAGISVGTNRKIFSYVLKLGFRIIVLSLAILAGSIAGGVFAGLILKMPLNITMMSAGGMSYYSLTGAFMTRMYGIELGTYGFIVNVMREFFTVLFLPLLIKISKGSPIACSGAASMDTLFVPITKTVGSDLGLIVLITGSILTFIVPILLPFIFNVFP